MFFYEVGYVKYAIALFFLSGVIVLLLDVRFYKISKLKKETKTAKIIGWLNISFSLMIVVMAFVYNHWFY